MTQPDFNLYPDEKILVAQLLTRLGNQFDFSNGKYEPDGHDRRIFEAAAKSEFGKIGIKVNVNWEQKRYFDGTPAPVYVPGVEPYARTKSEETDHDRMKWGIVKGLDDGQAGYVREDGTKHEEPIKKLIL